MPPPRKDNDQKLQERYWKMLEDILKLPGNDNCADCGTKGPRWASVNLGIFMCIRCSGIHRNMGTHISKVKSVSLDKWQPEMIRTVQIIGNANGKRIYEAKLPSGFPRPREEDTYAIEQWIRDKYDRKRWYDREVEMQILKGSAPPVSAEVPNPDDEKRLRREKRKKEREQNRERRQDRPTRTPPAAVPTADLLIDATKPAAPPAIAAPAVSATSSDFLFSDFQSASQSSNFIDAENHNAAFFQSSQSQPVQTSQPQPQQVPVQPPPPKSSKDDIMALFRQNHSNAANMGGMANMGMNNMGMNNMGMSNMGNGANYNMGMNMGMNNAYGMQNTGMNNMGMSGMNNMGMGVSGMQNMGMNNMNFNNAGYNMSANQGMNSAHFQQLNFANSTNQYGW